MEYRALILESIREIKTDLKSVEKRLAELERYSDIHEDFKKLKTDFDKFIVYYEKEFSDQNNRINPIEIRQRWLIAVYGTLGGIVASYLFRLFFETI